MNEAASAPIRRTGLEDHASSARKYIAHFLYEFVPGLLDDCVTVYADGVPIEAEREIIIIIERATTLSALVYPFPTRRFSNRIHDHIRALRNEFTNWCQVHRTQSAPETRRRIYERMQDITAEIAAKHGILAQLDVTKLHSESIEGTFKAFDNAMRKLAEDGVGTVRDVARKWAGL